VCEGMQFGQGEWMNNDRMAGGGTNDQLPGWSGNASKAFNF